MAGRHLRPRPAPSIILQPVPRQAGSVESLGSYRLDFSSNTACSMPSKVPASLRHIHHLPLPGCLPACPVCLSFLRQTLKTPEKSSDPPVESEEAVPEMLSICRSQIPSKLVPVRIFIFSKALRDELVQDGLGGPALFKLVRAGHGVYCTHNRCLGWCVIQTLTRGRDLCCVL